jgi:hypothetical protein
MNIKQIKKKYFELKVFNPPNNLIKTYKDFIEHRDYIEHYVFNEKVFESIIDITINLWCSDQRLNRISLLKSLTDYKKKCSNPNKLEFRVKRKLFELFLICTLNQNKLTKSQITYSYSKIISLIEHIELENDELNLLITNRTKSRLILKHIINYEFKSELISNWVKDNYNNKEYSLYRAKLISWMLDTNPDFVVSKKKLVLDFIHFNHKNDLKIKSYNQYLILSSMYEKGLISEDTLNENWEYHGGLDLKTMPHIETFYHYNDLKIMDEYKVYKRRIKKKFYENLELHQSITMLWAIYYSRLSLKEKEKLLIKFFKIENYYSFVKIAYRLKSTRLFKWLEKQCTK